MSLDPNAAGAVIDACEDQLTVAQENGAIQGLPEVIFKDGTYDALAKDIESAMDYHGIGPNHPRANGKLDVIRTLHLTAAAHDIAVSAIARADEAYKPGIDLDATVDLEYAVFSQVMLALVECDASAT